MISSEWVVIAVVLDVCREWSFDGEESVDILDRSVSACDELSSTRSPGIDSAFVFGVEFAVEGLFVHGMDSFIKSSSFGIDERVSHSSSFFATQRFCVHRSFEK